MPKTLQSTVYEYHELSDKAKEKARDWYVSAVEVETDHVYEDAAEVGNILGIDLNTRLVKCMDGFTYYEPNIYYSGFWSQGDGACYGATYRYAKGSLKAIRAYAPNDKELHRIAKELTRIQRLNFYSLRASTFHRGHYYHSGCMQVEAWDSRDDHYDVKECDVDDLEQVLRDFADWIYKRLEENYESNTSEEYVSENIMSNEYTFDENGNREG